jgi:cell division topological specificity factor
MTGFFDRMLGKNANKGSGATAKDRLKMVLVHDRIKISPEKMAEMKAEIVAVIAKYLPDVDPESVGIALEQSDRFQNKLVAEIPFMQGRERMLDENDDNDENDDLPRLEDDSDDTLVSKPVDPSPSEEVKPDEP